LFYEYERPQILHSSKPTIRHSMRMLISLRSNTGSNIWPARQFSYCHQSVQQSVIDRTVRSVRRLFTKTKVSPLDIKLRSLNHPVSLPQIDLNIQDFSMRIFQIRYLLFRAGSTAKQLFLNDFFKFVFIKSYWRLFRMICVEINDI
jgi:hypothetical protein